MESTLNFIKFYDKHIKIKAHKNIFMYINIFFNYKYIKFNVML